jgi:hypothetical protein
MPEHITDYYLAEFPTPVHAEKTAARIADACLKRGVVIGAEGPLRAVIWTASPLADTGALYLSVGALQVAQAEGITITPSRRVPAEELPAHRALLLGEPRDRV